MGYHRSSLLALAIAGLIGAVGASTADALTVTNYTQIGNQGTKVVTNSTPLSVVSSSVTAPYGPPPPTFTPSGTGVLLTFAPTGTFASQATNASGGQEVDTDGKLDFMVTFDSAINLTAIINEGGTFSTTGNGTVQVFAGGIVIEAVDTLPLESIGSGALATTFNSSNNTWSGSATLSGFVNKYTTYKFSIDNDLIANTTTSATSSTANIAKTGFSILINQGGATTPEPASLSLLGLGVAGLMLRRRR